MRGISNNSGEGSPKGLDDLTVPELYELLVRIHLDIERILAQLVVAGPASDLVDH